MKTIIKKIFSVTNSKDKKHKIITILGLKIKIKRYNFILEDEKRKEERYNQFKFDLLKPTKFTQIRLELSNACGYKCAICPHDKMTRKVGFLQDSDIERIASNIEYRDEIEQVHLHGFGEPLLIKDLFHKAEVVRKYFPNATIQILSTLGYEVAEDFFEKLINSEINQIWISFYGYNKENYKVMHGVDKYDLAYQNLLKLIKINKKYNNKLDIHINLYNSDSLPNVCELPNNSFLMEKLIQEINELGHSQQYGYLKLHNYGSGKNFTKFNKYFPCSILYGNYKTYLQISWNLNVIPCCMVWNDETVLGNLKEQTLDEIFNSDYYKEFLNSHLCNDLDKYVSCRNCSKYYDSTPEQMEFMKRYLLEIDKNR